MTLFDAAVAAPGGHRDVRPDQVFADRLTTRIVDVRELDEFHGELGHIRGAEPVPLAALPAASAPWNRREALVLVCRSGNRSEQAARTLKGLGFQRVMNMLGGMVAWHKAHLPVEG